MEILRKPPYPLSVSYTVPEPDTEYILVIDDLLEQVESEIIIESDENSVLTYELTGNYVRYDKSYPVTVYESVTVSGVENTRGDIVVEDNLDITRPYVDPASLGTTPTEIAEYTEHEKLARAIIDAFTGGFYYNRTYLEVVGQGTDYVPLWDKTHKILTVHENAELVYDSSETPNILGVFNYLITKDKSAITKDPVELTDALNRAERKPARIPLAYSDSISMFDTEDSGNVQTVSSGVGFAEGTDYIFLLETGYKVVPYDIQDAAKMLINDIKCGKLDYYKRYVKMYSTEQFKIEYDKRLLDGTGNILVDKILDKYVDNLPKPWVL
jgi:hypothetical protein